MANEGSRHSSMQEVRTGNICAGFIWQSIKMAFCRIELQLTSSCLSPLRRRWLTTANQRKVLWGKMKLLSHQQMTILNYIQGNKLYWLSCSSQMLAWQRSGAYHEWKQINENVSSNRQPRLYYCSKYPSSLKIYFWLQPTAQEWLELLLYKFAPILLTHKFNNIYRGSNFGWITT